MKIVELLAVALATASCATTVHRGTADTAPLPGHTDRMIVEVTSGEVLGYRSVLKDLQSVRHIYVGERHAVPGYQETQLEVLRLIHRSGTEVGVGIEWLPMESQPIIDAFIARDINEPEFVKRVRWRHMWGHNYEAYSPIFRYARQHNIPIWALGA
ncbi:MAG: ChaN family lipoprotein, partial [Myxococcota bacterium]|nr:ChaN family lipoprotein [Myxococcota bacterium]